jgi:CheY-like chemotaxis protein
VSWYDAEFVRTAAPLAIIVEDDAAVRDLERDILEEAGFRIWPVATPPDIADLQCLRPDLLVLDLVLDGDLRGLDFLLDLRADPETMALPVVACTAHVDLDDPDEARLRALVQAVLRKPFDIDDLVRVARACLAPEARRPLTADGPRD